MAMKTGKNRYKKAKDICKECIKEITKISILKDKKDSESQNSIETITDICTDCTKKVSKIKKKHNKKD